MKVEGTFIEFTKNLIDELNAFLTLGTHEPTYNTLNMDSLHFYDSIVVVEKRAVPYKSLRLRIGETVHFKNTTEFSLISD